jgi:predicted transcriptional regulator
MAPSLDAIIPNALTLLPEDTVKKALDIFYEKNIRNIPVVKEDGTFVGLFGLHELLSNILPQAVQMGKGIQSMDYLVGGAPGAAKKLRKSYDLKVGDLCNKKAAQIEADTTTWEALRVMVMQGSPLPIVDKKTGQYKGIISRQSLLRELERMLAEIEAEEAGQQQAG